MRVLREQRVIAPAEEMFQIGPEALSSRFAKISARLGVTLLPPEGLAVIHFFCPQRQGEAFVWRPTGAP